MAARAEVAILVVRAELAGLPKRTSPLRLAQIRSRLRLAELEGQGYTRIILAAVAAAAVTQPYDVAGLIWCRQAAVAAVVVVEILRGNSAAMGVLVGEPAA